MEKFDMLNTVNTSIASLRQDLDEHHRLLMAMLDGNPQASASQPSQAAHHSGQHEQMYRAAISHAIRILEDSRKSFKSKQLGDLRKQLMNVLIDA